MDSPIYKSVTAFAPASVANVGCGFDIMGFAVENIGDKVTVSLSDNNCTDIKLTGPYANLIPTGRLKNTSGVAIDAYLKATNNQHINVTIQLEKNLPLGSGMGSSASSAAAGVFAINHLLGSPLSAKELIPFAMEGERVACNSAHADNVAPSLLGGFVLIRSYNPLDIISIPCSNELYSAIVHPHMELHTVDARKVLKQEFSITDAIMHSANTAGFMVALLTNDYNLLKRSMHDTIAEPKRMLLIPGYEGIKKAVMDEGALGCSISGSGPSVFALCKGKEHAEKISKIMQEKFLSIGLESETFISSLHAKGTYITEAIKKEVSHEFL